MAVSVKRVTSPLDNMIVWEWADMANGDVGEPVVVGSHNDKTVQAFGTFGAAGSVAFEGSNELDPVTAANLTALHDPSVTTIALTSSAPISAVLEHPAIARPHVTAGDGTTKLTVRLATFRR